MKLRATYLLASVAMATGLLGVATAPVSAETVMQQCSAKYQAAKTAGTLAGQSWNQFRSACSKELKAEPASATQTPGAAAPAPQNPLKPAVAPAAPAPAPAPTTTAAAPAPTTTAAAPAAPPPTAVPSNVVFPTAVSPKYAAEKAYIARRKTCDDQYKANKATNGNAGLKWSFKGGGYYHECNLRLKG